MPTSYPKCSPTEMLGLLVLLDSHHGSEDVALLADDLDLEIDEIFPALEYAEILQFVKVSDGRATFTDLGKRLVAGTIRSRKAILREQLRRTTLFKTLVRALEGAPEHQLSDHDLGQIVSLTTTPSEEAVQNIINWGRYADLFRYDADSHRLLAVRTPAAAKTGGGKAPPPSPPAGAPPPSSGKRAASPPAENPAAKMARASA
ncbi:MAG TPA: AAA-associated domain-containing protein [Thermoplasmata archaeon]|nr:AAA-associated domain-containing protein [Thermoplasmata archaeon]